VLGWRLGVQSRSGSRCGPGTMDQTPT
jgi:hypothetical protein